MKIRNLDLNSDTGTDVINWENCQILNKTTGSWGSNCGQPSAIVNGRSIVRIKLGTSDGYSHFIGAEGNYYNIYRIPREDDVI